jgi:hypothetical protein
VFEKEAFPVVGLRLWFERLALCDCDTLAKKMESSPQELQWIMMQKQALLVSGIT